MKTMPWAILCALAAGCAATNQVSPETMQQATAPLICHADDECALWWQRAQDWVTHHAAYKLQTASDTLIATAGPSGGSGKLAYQITKASNNDGTSTIGFAAHCNSAIDGCHPDPWRAAADFKRFVRTGAEPPP